MSTKIAHVLANIGAEWGYGLFLYGRFIYKIGTNSKNRILIIEFEPADKL